MAKAKTAPRPIAAYHHRSPATTPEAPDPRPGAYYATVRDGKRAGILAGPFRTHRAALDVVDAATEKAMEVNDRGIWYSYGTARFEAPVGPGVLNELLGLVVDGSGYVG